MSMVFLARGVSTFGMVRRAADGTTIEQTPAKFETDPEGGCVAVGELDPETMEQKGGAVVFGDFDTAGYLKRAAQLLGPGRPGNLPDFEGIIKSMCRARFDDDCPFLEHFHRMDCRNCVVDEWRQEAGEGAEHGGG